MPNLEDERNRERIVSHLDVTFLVEAGAGSGKTTSLVNRMVALVGTGKAEVQEIAAITFTRKAASELRSRFQVALEAALQDRKPSPEPDSKSSIQSGLEPDAMSGTERDRLERDFERDRLERALRSLNLCFIGTIHSFCGRLLRERPLEAQIDPGFREAEEEEDWNFADACWDDYLMQLTAKGDSEDLRALSEMGINVEDLRAVYHRVSAYPDVRIEAQEVERPDFDAVRDSLLRLVDEALPWMPAYEPEKGWDKLQDVVRQTHRLRQRGVLDSDVEFVRILERLYEKKLEVTQNRWTDKAMAKELKGQFADWQDVVMTPFLRRWREYRHPYVIRFVQPAIDFCRQRRVQAGLLNFQDLLMNAAALLRHYSEVRQYFRHRYQRLFVDEFQDTDPIQAEVMFLLTGTETEESNWRRVSPKPGSLFIVGDPKQSIYRFRRADIATYNFVKGRIEASGGEVLRLSANFRSVNSIGRFVDAHFQGVFPAEETAHQAKFITLATKRSDPQEHFGVFKITHPKSLGNKDAVIAADAKRIARLIRFACDGNAKVYEYNRAGGVTGSRPATPGDFLILTHRKDSMHPYGEALEEYGIPAEVVDSQQTFRELHNLAVLAACLANPADNVSLTAVLRGIWFGISDNQLYHYKREGHGLSLFHLPSREEMSELTLPVQQAIEQLRVYQEWTKRMPAVAALERILEAAGYLVYTALQPGGMARAGFVTTLLEHLDSQPEAAANWPQLTKVLTDLAEGGSLPSASLYPGRADVVRIMNLHKAKGLEAPIVFLAAPCGYSEHEPDSHVNRESDEGTGYFVVDKEGTGANSKRTILAQPTGWDEFAQRESRFLQAERHRLLYVAVTRPRQMLVVSQWEDVPQKDPWSPLAGVLETAPELPEVEVDKPVPSAAPTNIHVRDWLKHRNEQIEHLALPTFIRTSVTTEVKRPGSGLAGWEDGFGTGLSSEARDALDATADPASDAGFRKEAGGSVETAERGGDVGAAETGRVEEAGEPGLVRRGGKGAAFGSAVHRTLEAAGKGLARHRLPTYAKLMAMEEGVPAEDAEYVMPTVKGVLQSEIWQRALQAKHRLHEVPFVIADKIGEAVSAEASVETAAAHDGAEHPLSRASGVDEGSGRLSSALTSGLAGSAAGSAAEQTLLVHGVIDMVFEEADGWVIVDFKTDGFEPEQETAFVEHYKPQVQYYAKVWQEKFGHPVKEVGLYFTNRQRFIVVN